MKYITYLLSVSFLISQLEITLYRAKTNRKSYEIELKILENIKILHQRRKKEELKLNIIELKRFKDVLVALEKAENNNVMAMSGISITEERMKKFSFSNPYIFATECILGLKKSNKIKDEDWGKKGVKIGYTVGGTSEKRVKLLAKKYQIQAVEYDTAEKSSDGLKNGEVDFFVTDNIFIWHDPQIKIIHEFKEKFKTGYGITFKKNSPFKKMFDPYIKYTMRAQHFRELLLKTYGKEYLDFYKDSY